MRSVKAAGHKDVRWCGAYKVDWDSFRAHVSPEGIASQGTSCLYFIEFRLKVSVIFDQHVLWQ